MYTGGISLLILLQHIYITTHQNNCQRIKMRSISENVFYSRDQYILFLKLLLIKRKKSSRWRVIKLFNNCVFGNWWVIISSNYCRMNKLTLINMKSQLYRIIEGFFSVIFQDIFHWYLLKAFSYRTFRQLLGNSNYCTGLLSLIEYVWGEKDHLSLPKLWFYSCFFLTLCCCSEKMVLITWKGLTFKIINSFLFC